MKKFRIGASGTYIGFDTANYRSRTYHQGAKR